MFLSLNEALIGAFRMTQFIAAICFSHDRNMELFLRRMKLIQFAMSPELFHILSTTNSFPIFPDCLQGKKMAICTDNITDVTLKDMVAESEDFSNFVGAFVCQSTIIPSDSKGFRTALALQSNSLADRFLGTWFVLCILLQVSYLGAGQLLSVLVFLPCVWSCGSHGA